MKRMSTVQIMFLTPRVQKQTVFLGTTPELAAHLGEIDAIRGGSHDRGRANGRAKTGDYGWSASRVRRFGEENLPNRAGLFQLSQGRELKQSCNRILF
jgi:hypothetical protein